ncbi:MAG: peptidylprolyl isomerase [Muribaculaceae bacterium]|nr:peptidylprolyl isomerase [Muribaculaceae bacterium]
MKKTLTTIGLAAAALISIGIAAKADTSTGPKKNVIDEVAWIVGDNAIYKSEIEEAYSEMRSMGVSPGGDPYCVIPEQLAVEKLYLHQGKLDTIEAPASQLSSRVEMQMNWFVKGLGSREKVEEMFRKPWNAIRDDVMEKMKANFIKEQVQDNLTKNVKATPNDVKKYFAKLPADSIPYVPMQVEVQLMQLNPLIPKQEIEDVKARLRDFTDRVNKGESDFSTLAILYSEDPVSAPRGGELGYTTRSTYVPEFANVAFNLNDPKKVSRIVETEFGFHIIQFIDRKGDEVNVRHILLKPKVNEKDLRDATMRLDSIRKEIAANQFTFDESVRFFSQDKDSKNNKGIMINSNQESERFGTTRFEMQDLPPEIARRIENMQPGDISEPFIMTDQKKNQEVAVMVRLQARIPGHSANLAEDYNMLKRMYENATREKIIKDWVEQKIKDTYVHISDGWNNCEFRYDGWEKEKAEK